jgi:hypothetical protein
MDMHVRHLMTGLVASLLAAGLPASPLSAQANRDMPSGTDSALVSNESRTLIEADAARASVLTTRQPVALRSVRVHRDSTERGLPMPSPRTERGSDLALMGVGGAAVVVGLLVGGDAGAAVAIGGGAVGLIGLYRYLR